MIAYGVLKTSKVDFSAPSFESKVKYTQIMSNGLTHNATFFFKKRMFLFSTWITYGVKMATWVSHHK